MPSPSNKIRALDQKLAGTGVADTGPHADGDGHRRVPLQVVPFKLTGESLEFLDKQINDWLDAHPQFEVKFVTTSVGSGRASSGNRT
jgi:hypothetical protein